MLFSFFFCGKKFNRMWKLIFNIHKKVIYSTKDQKSIRKVHRKCAQMSKWWQSCHFGVKYNFMSLLTSAVYLFCHYIFLSNISTSTWCAEIHIFVMLPFHIYRNKMNIWNDKHRHEAFTKILLRSVWSQIWWRTEEGLTRLSTCRASDNAERWIIQSIRGVKITVKQSSSDLLQHLLSNSQHLSK